MTVDEHKHSPDDISGVVRQPVVTIRMNNTSNTPPKHATTSSTTSKDHTDRTRPNGEVNGKHAVNSSGYGQTKTVQSTTHKVQHYELQQADGAKTRTKLPGIIKSTAKNSGSSGTLHTKTSNTSKYKPKLHMSWQGNTAKHFGRPPGLLHAPRQVTPWTV